MAERIIDLPTEKMTTDLRFWLRERIVRCKDCKYATPDTSGRKRYKGYLWCDELTEGIGFCVAPSDFCAWGEVRQ